MKTLNKVQPLHFLWIAMAILFSSGCSNSICNDLVLEVDLLEKEAKENYNYAMKNPTTVTEGSSYSVAYTRGVEEIEETYRREMRVPARIISNNQQCFDAKRVAEAQELIAEK